MSEQREALKFFGIFVGLLGLSYLTALTSWKVAGCVLLMLWGNNIVEGLKASPPRDH